MRDFISRFSKPIIIGFVVIAFAIVGIVDLLPARRATSVPDHWTAGYETATWNDFNLGNVRGRYEKGCVLTVIEAAFPNPRDAKPVIDKGMKDHSSPEAAQLQELADNIRNEC